MRIAFPTSCIVLVTCLGAAPAAQAQRPDSLGITTAELGARLRFLSSDLFEGRAPGTRGEALTTAYLTSELESFGLRPGARADSGGAWLQAVSIVTHRPDTTSPNEARLSGRVTRVLQHGRDIRFSNFGSEAEVRTGGDLVFVGYGIHAPVYGWDDLRGIDLRGKIAVALLGEPEIPGDTVTFNGGRASRFSWGAAKVAELERRGAVGVLWLSGGRPLSRSPVTGGRRLAADAQGSLRLTGLLADSTLATLLPRGSGPLTAVLERARRRGFRAIPLGTRLDVAFRTRPTVVTTHNVIGVVPGRDSGLAGEHVVLSAHWDAYGIGPAAAGDSIYNGALDDGSGITALLALARVFAAHPQQRSLTFLFTTAEEWGLLGAQAYVCEGPLPTARMAANLNIDHGIELMGEMKDAAPLGIELSTLGRNVAEVAGAMKLRVSPDPYPSEGFFLRADNHPFARAGVPALYMAMGTDGARQSKAAVDSAVNDYLEHHYHRPSDEYATVVRDLRGAQQFAEFIRDVTISVANAAERPTWLAGAEFQRPEATVSGCAGRTTPPASR